MCFFSLFSSSTSTLSFENKKKSEIIFFLLLLHCKKKKNNNRKRWMCICRKYFTPYHAPSCFFIFFIFCWTPISKKPYLFLFHSTHSGYVKVKSFRSYLPSNSSIASVSFSFFCMPKLLKAIPITFRLFHRFCVFFLVFCVSWLQVERKH